jgi:hypothetical protein
MAAISYFTNFVPLPNSHGITSLMTVIWTPCVFRSWILSRWNAWSFVCRKFVIQFIELDYKSIRCLWKFHHGHTEITTVNVRQTTRGCGHWFMSVFLTPDFLTILGITWLPCCETNSHGLTSYRSWCYMAVVFFSLFSSLTWNSVSRLCPVEEGGQWVYGLPQSSHLCMVVHIFLPLMSTMANQVSKNFCAS